MSISTRVEHWVGEQLDRHPWLWFKTFGWFVRLAHVLGWHNLALYTPDGEVEGITFGTKQYVNEVIDAHEQVFGDDEGPDEDMDPEPPDAA